MMLARCAVEFEDNQMLLTATLNPDREHMQADLRWHHEPTAQNCEAWSEWFHPVMSDVLRRLQKAERAAFN